MLERQPRRRPIRDSYRQRGIRVRAQKTGSPEATTVQIDRSALAAQKTHGSGPRAGSVSTWAMLIKRVYEVDPLSCPQCGSPMKVVAFIEPRAPERSNGRGEVIEEILRHCGLWQASAPGPPPDVEDLVLDLDAAYSDSSIGSPDQADQSQELTYVDIDTFLATF